MITINNTLNSNEVGNCDFLKTRHVNVFLEQKHGGQNMENTLKSCEDNC